MPVPSPGKHTGEMTLISLNLSVDNHCVSFKFGSSTSSAISEQPEFYMYLHRQVVALLNDAYATLNSYSSGTAHT